MENPAWHYEERAQHFLGLAETGQGPSYGVVFAEMGSAYATLALVATLAGRTGEESTE